MNKKIEKTKPIFLEGNSKIGILLLHGWTSYTEELLPLGKYLNSLGYTVYAPVLRGHGTKPEDLLGVTWREWLEDANNALEKLKEKTPKIFLGGISMGGNLALMLSNDKKVVGIFAMSPAIRYKYHHLAKLALFFMGLTKTYRYKYFPPWVRKHMGYRRVYSYYPVESARTAARLAEELGRFLPNIKKPVLILQSTTDHMVSKKSPQTIFSKVNSKIKEIFWVENTYHVFMEKKEVQAKIAKFISKVMKAEP